MTAFLTLSSNKAIAFVGYFPVGQQLFGSVVASLQHPPCSSFPEQHFAPQHPSCTFFSLYIQSSYNHRIIKISERYCNACVIIMQPGGHIGLNNFPYFKLIIEIFTFCYNILRSPFPYWPHYSFFRHCSNIMYNAWHI